MKLGRRALIRGGVATAGAAALSLGASRFVRAAAGPHAKFVFVVEGNCVEPVAMLSPTARDAMNGMLRAPVGTNRWWYRDYQHSELTEVPTPDLAEALSLGPLGSLASRSSVLYGLSCKASGGGHTPYHGAMSATRTVAGSPGGPTIDAYLASRVDAFAERPFDVLRVGVGDRPINNQTCALDAGKPAPILLKPTTAYQVVLGAATGDRGFARRGEMLAFAREDVTHRLADFGGPVAERAKLETYLASIEQVELQQSRLRGITLDPATLPPPPADDPRYASASSMDRLSVQFDIATAALQGGLTQVAVIASSTGDDFGSVTYPSLVGPGMPLRRHELHHESAGDAAIRDVIHQVSGKHVEYIARMANALAATPDPSGGTMLDNTVIVYLGDNGEQHHSTASEFPVLLVGGENLGVSGGRTLVYPGLAASEHRRLSNLWITLAQLAGIDTQEFGGDDFTRVPNGALPGLV